MHRSGTSFLAQVLQCAGLFMGVFKDHHYEAVHFMALNQQCLAAQQASWLHPVAVPAATRVSLSANELYREHFQVNTRLQQWQLAWQNPAWGWKDPRNTFTLPVWLRVFPQARVIHLIRDAEEVANSLQKRNGKAGEGYYPELDDRHFCLELTQKYQSQGKSYAADLGGRYLEINYSALYHQEPLALQQMEQFTGKALQPIIKKLRR